jgi:hypothetical protein
VVFVAGGRQVGRVIVLRQRASSHRLSAIPEFRVHVGHGGQLALLFAQTGDQLKWVATGDAILVLV